VIIPPAPGNGIDETGQHADSHQGEEDHGVKHGNSDAVTLFRLLFG